MDRVKRKCLSVLGLVCKVKQALPAELRKHLYQALVQPHLDYCAAVWAECSKQDATKLDRIQKKGMRMILDESWDCPSASMRSRLGWMTVGNRMKTMRAAVTKRYLSGDCPRYMVKLFRMHKDLGLRSARRENDIYLPSIRSNWKANSFRSLQGRH